MIYRIKLTDFRNVTYILGNNYSQNYNFVDNNICMDFHINGFHMHIFYQTMIENSEDKTYRTCANYFLIISVTI